MAAGKDRSVNPEELATLLRYATPREADLLRGIAGAKRTTAQNSAMARVRRRAARKDPELHSNAAPAGYHVKGVSTLRKDAQGNQQWLKTQRDAIDPEEVARALQSAIAAADIEPRQPTKARPVFDSELLNVMPVGDPHFGMLSWPAETGADWNLKIAAEVHARAIGRLFRKAPLARECLLVWMGDNSHADDATGLTPASKHKLDTDSRWERTLEILFTAMCNSINTALAHHTRVSVRIIKGNHDPHVATALALGVEAYYRQEPRVAVERQPTPLYVQVHGRNLLAFAHGHAPTPERVPDILASDYRKEIGETEQGYLYTGHKHSKILSERGGLIMEAVQTLAPRDAWATHAGYRSGRSLFVDTYSTQTLGSIQRICVAAQDLGEIE